jgi:hypothetical protein
MRNLHREPFPFGHNLDDCPAEHALAIWCDNFDTKVVVLPLVELPGLDGKPCLAFAVITNILGFGFGSAVDPPARKSRGGLRFELFTADDADERAEFVAELIRGSLATWVNDISDDPEAVRLTREIWQARRWLTGEPRPRRN